MSSIRFCHVLFSSKSVLRIIYKSFTLPIHNQQRLFRLNLYKPTKNYFHFQDFHYISYKKKPIVNQIFLLFLFKELFFYLFIEF